MTNWPSLSITLMRTCVASNVRHRGTLGQLRPEGWFLEGRLAGERRKVQGGSRSGLIARSSPALALGAHEIGEALGAGLVEDVADVGADRVLASSPSSAAVSVGGERPAAGSPRRPPRGP